VLVCVCVCVYALCVNESVMWLFNSYAYYILHVQSHGDQAVLIPEGSFSRVMSALTKAVVFRDVMSPSVTSEYYRNQTDVEYAHAVLHQLGVEFRKVASATLKQRVKLTERDTVAEVTSYRSTMKFSLRTIKDATEKLLDSVVKLSAALLCSTPTRVLGFRPHVSGNTDLRRPVQISDGRVNVADRFHLLVPQGNQTDLASWLSRFFELSRHLAALTYISTGGILRGVELTLQRGIPCSTAPRDMEVQLFDNDYAVLLKSMLHKMGNYTGHASTAAPALIGLPARFLLLYMAFIRPVAVPLMIADSVPGFLFLMQGGVRLSSAKLSDTLAAMSSPIAGSLRLSSYRQGMTALHKANLIVSVEKVLRVQTNRRLARDCNHAVTTRNSTYGNSSIATSIDTCDSFTIANAHAILVYQSVDSQPLAVHVIPTDSQYSKAMQKFGWGDAADAVNEEPTNPSSIAQSVAHALPFTSSDMEDMKQMMFNMSKQVRVCVYGSYVCECTRTYLVFIAHTDVCPTHTDGSAQSSLLQRQSAATHGTCVCVCVWVCVCEYESVTCLLGG
jgi:hypothetical protein